MKPLFRFRMQLCSEEQGGRSTPIFHDSTGVFRKDLRFSDGMHRVCGWIIDGGVANPGDEFEVDCVFVFPTNIEISVGDQIEYLEGPADNLRLYGTGKIIEIYG